MASPAPSDSSTSSSSSSSSSHSQEDIVQFSRAPPSPSPVFAPRPVRLPQSYFRLQRPLVFGGGGTTDEGLATNWKRMSPSPALREEVNGRRRTGSVSSLSSTNSALAGTRLESVDEGFDADRETGNDYSFYSSSLNGDIIEELRTITRLPPASIDRTESPGYNSMISRFSNMPLSTDASNGESTVPLRTPSTSEGHRRMLSDSSRGGASPAEGRRRTLPSPISRQIMRNPILHNESFNQE